MTGITKILVPVDFSPPAETAFRFALRIGTLLSAELHLLHVMYPQMESIDDPLAPVATAVRNKTRLTEQKLLKFIAPGSTQWEQSGQSLPGISVHVAYGGAIAEIRNMSRKHHYDLIVMGTRGEHATTEKLLGTVASDVVGTAICPVIVVPEQTVDRPVERVVHAIEPKRVKTRQVISLISQLLPLHRELHLVRFSKLTEEGLPARLLRMQEELQLEFPSLEIVIHRLSKEDLVQDMQSFLEQKGMDLLVMYRSSSGFYRRLFHRSKTREMAKYTTVPLLVV